MTAVTLETQAQAYALLHHFPSGDAANHCTAPQGSGEYHVLQSNYPVTIFSCDTREPMPTAGTFLPWESVQEIRWTLADAPCQADAGARRCHCRPCKSSSGFPRSPMTLQHRLRTSGKFSNPSGVSYAICHRLSPSLAVRHFAAGL